MSEQGPRFNAGFTLVTHRLLDSLEKIKGLRMISEEGTVEAVQLFSENFDEEEPKDFAKSARYVAETVPDC